MRVIKEKTIRVMGRRNPEASHGLARWLELVEEGDWRHLADVRTVFRHADEVKVASGRTVVVFNIAGNKYRLIAAIHYDRKNVFVLMLLTHAQYSKDRWKDEL
jgi:mRNA interferase HigB